MDRKLNFLNFFGSQVAPIHNNKVVILAKFWLLQLSDCPYYANFISVGCKRIHAVGANT